MSCAQSSQRSSTQEHIRVLIADDRETICSGLAAFIFSVPDFQRVGEAKDGAQAVQLSGQLRPDTVILNLFLPGMDGAATAQAIRAASPQTRVVALLNFADHQLMVEATRAGVSEYLLLDCTAAQLEAAVRRAHAA